MDTLVVMGGRTGKEMMLDGIAYLSASLWIYCHIVSFLLSPVPEHEDFRNFVIYANVIVDILGLTNGYLLVTALEVIAWNNDHKSRKVQAITGVFMLICAWMQTLSIFFISCKQTSQLALVSLAIFSFCCEQSYKQHCYECLGTVGEFGYFKIVIASITTHQLHAYYYSHDNHRPTLFEYYFWIVIFITCLLLTFFYADFWNDHDFDHLQNKLPVGDPK